MPNLAGGNADDDGHAPPSLQGVGAVVEFDLGRGLPVDRHRDVGELAAGRTTAAQHHPHRRGGVGAGLDEERRRRSGPEDVRAARRLAGEILFLAKRRLIEQAPAAQFFSSPATEEARRFVAGDLVI